MRDVLSQSFRSSSPETCLSVWLWCNARCCPQRVCSSLGHRAVPFIPLPRSARGTASITLCFWQELNVEMGQHQEDLAALEQLAVELGASSFVPGAAAQQEKLQNLKEEFLQLQKVAKER